LIRVDPELRRIAFPNPEQRELRATWHRAFPAEIGGGEYNRAAGLATRPGVVPTLFPNDSDGTLQDAIAAVAAGGGILEIRSNDVFILPDPVISPAPPTDSAGDEVEVILRAGNGFRPILRVSEPLEVSGGIGARVTLNGLTIEGAGARVVPTGNGESLSELTIAHCTLIPGLSYRADGGPQSPGSPSLTIQTTGVEVSIVRSILGPIRMTDTTNATLVDSIVDAAAAQSIDSPDGLAIAGSDDAAEPAGNLTIHASTILGRIHARSFPLVSDSILHARSEPDAAPVRAVLRQQGCMRFTFVPTGSVVPRRYRCQPQLAIDQQLAATQAAQGARLSESQRTLIATRIRRWLIPSFTALSASHPAYCQLHGSVPEEIRRGASHGGEMGVYHLLHQPQRETNLRIRIEEYLRFGLEAGVFFET
jgi:hypothetical protein